MRAENFVGDKVEHISFNRDAPMFNFANTKTHQEGIKNIDHPSHIYANPLDPVFLNMISLAWYIIAHPSILTGQRNLL